LAALDARFAGSSELRSAARIQLGALDMAVGELDQAERVLRATPSPEADALLARCRLARGDYVGAGAIAHRLLDATPDDVSTLNVSALAALARGEPLAAGAALSRALKKDPFDREALKILTHLEDQTHVESH
jgi:tetratricopeptide (TPR) repeat protein